MLIFNHFVRLKKKGKKRGGGREGTKEGTEWDDVIKMLALIMSSSAEQVGGPLVCNVLTK